MGLSNSTESEDTPPETKCGHTNLDEPDKHLRKHLDSISQLQQDISAIPYAEYEYPFENLVFEGGGAKGQVYVGCLRVSFYWIMRCWSNGPSNIRRFQNLSLSGVIPSLSIAQF